jgi:hypothetical protein
MGTYTDCSTLARIKVFVNESIKAKPTDLKVFGLVRNELGPIKRSLSNGDYKKLKAKTVILF